ncbi:Inositol polyphosphate multikinase [Acipenser ruthenus]|uniref:Kinase n=2 Tax=Acipenser ruthenus TaxID=7906 RepID=A0A444UMM3_ACIRT|nr:Inositol polyphosphate multikinase [Acipenser ruthenus]
MNARSMSKAELIAAISLTAGAAAIGYMAYKTFMSKEKCCKTRVNLEIQKDNPKVVHAFDIEDLGDKAVYCRCWRSKKTSKMTTQHQIVDSSLTLGQNQIISCDSDRSASEKEKRNTQDGSQKHLNGCVPLSHQVAGHKYGVDKVGILQHPDGTVLKQLQPPPRGPRELKFYSMVYDEHCCDPVLLDLQMHLPKYYGTWTPADAPNDLYLKLDDVTRKFNKPCIMDVKIGQKSYDPYALKEKKDQQIRKYPLMEEIGFLVLGMRIYQVNTDSYETHDQHYGRGLIKETIKDGLTKFFFNGNSVRKDAIAASIQKVQKILQWFQSQSQLHFYASSLLFVYEGSSQQTAQMKRKAGSLADVSAAPKGCPTDGEVLEYNNNVCVIGSMENGRTMASFGQSLSNMYALHKKGCSQGHRNDVPLQIETREQDNSLWKCTTPPNGNKPQLEKESHHMPAVMQKPNEVEVRMIDFAHVFPSNTKDEGYVYGLKNLLTVLQQILNN